MNAEFLYVNVECKFQIKSPIFNTWPVKSQKALMFCNRYIKISTKIIFYNPILCML